jgi:hypothetical protein
MIVNDIIKRLSQKSDFFFYFTDLTVESVGTGWVLLPTTKAVGSYFIRTTWEQTDLPVGARMINGRYLISYICDLKSFK